MRVYNSSNTRSPMAFLEEVRRRLPSAIQRIQTDDDSSFGLQFTWLLADLGIAHRHVPPASPEVNGKAERSHTTDAQEYYRGAAVPESGGVGLQAETPGERVRPAASSSRPQGQDSSRASLRTQPTIPNSRGIPLGSIQTHYKSQCPSTAAFCGNGMKRLVPAVGLEPTT